MGTVRWLAMAAVAIVASGQYIGEENKTAIQETAVVDGRNRELKEISSWIYTNKTSTYLNCAAGSMLVDIEFNEPFYGIVYPNGSRNSACFTHGSGAKKYHLELPLKGCGTQRIERRVFLNNIMVRFHKGLELEGDEVKTIICRYPSPQVLLPPIPARLLTPAGAPPSPSKHVGEIEILMIICGILFLALVLVGMACSYTCLKKRNIQLVRRRAPSMAPSTISKMSGSSLLIGGLNIPRATVSASESDTNLVSETLPSDYPSESPSSGSEVDIREAESMERVSVREEIQAYENTAFEIEDRLSSVYSDACMQSDGEMITAHQITKPPQPSFMVRIKKPPSPPRTPEPDYPIQLANSQSLTTIFERDESFRGESIPGSEHAMMMSVAGDLEVPALLNPPVRYSHGQKQVQAIPQPPPPPPSDFNIRRVENLETITQETTDITETEERLRQMHSRRQMEIAPDSDYPSETRSVASYQERPAVMVRPPVQTTHTVDDRSVNVITETHVTEDIERHKRYTKQYHVRPRPPKWNVAIRHYPGPKYADEMESSGPEWENYSEPGSEVFRRPLYYDSDSERPELTEHPYPHNWNILLKVLDPPETHLPERCVLSQEDMDKWYQILHTESTLRTMLTTASIREDFERIRHDSRYERLFSPQKWEVIIRILSPPNRPTHPYDTSSDTALTSDAESIPSRDPRRYRKYEPSGYPGRRGSLPPVHEYGDHPGTHGTDTARSRRSSKSSVVSGVRSVTETEVNFGRSTSHYRNSGDYPDTDTDDRLSAKTGRSLARSTTEFVEDWRAPRDGPQDHPPLLRGESQCVEDLPSEAPVLFRDPEHSPPPQRRRLFHQNESEMSVHESSHTMVHHSGGPQGIRPSGGRPSVMHPHSETTEEFIVHSGGAQAIRPSGRMMHPHSETPEDFIVHSGVHPEEYMAYPENQLDPMMIHPGGNQTIVHHKSGGNQSTIHHHSEQHVSHSSTHELHNQQGGTRTEQTSKSEHVTSSGGGGGRVVMRHEERTEFR